eukprot:6111039-Pleurochrysis_carterae.AAC.1
MGKQQQSRSWKNIEPNKKCHMHGTPTLLQTRGSCQRKLGVGMLMRVHNLHRSIANSSETSATLPADMLIGSWHLP